MDTRNNTYMIQSTTNRISIIFGTVFLVMGFVAYLSNDVIGTASFFDTSHIQNFMHIFTGIVFLIAGFKSQRIGLITLTFVGMIYCLFSLLGLSSFSGRVGGLLENNLAIEVLYMILGLSLVAFGRLEILRGE